MSVLETAKQRPVTSALVVLGGVGLVWFAVGRQTSEPEQSADPFAVGGFTYAGPSDAQVSAATALQISQMEDARAIRELETTAALSAAQLQSQHTIQLAQITKEDAANARQIGLSQYVTNAQLEEIKLSAARDQNALAETNRSNEVIANLNTRIRLEELASNERLGIAQNNAQINATRAQEGTKRTSSILGAVGTVAGIIGAFF